MPSNSIRSKISAAGKIREKACLQAHKDLVSWTVTWLQKYSLTKKYKGKTITVYVGNNDITFSVSDAVFSQDVPKVLNSVWTYASEFFHDDMWWIPTVIKAKDGIVTATVWGEKIKI